jgi:predicted dehydrogenase
MKVIQVGIGGMGNAWLRCVLESPDVEYAGFVEVNDAIAKAQAEKYGLDSSSIFNSLDQALKAVPADGVIVVTPPQFHREVSIAALEAGIPVLSEKPLADTAEAARDIVQKANETGVLHMVAQNYRYRAPIQTLRQLLESGTMGRVASATVEFFRGPHFGGFREDMPYPLITDMSIHHFDLMRFLLASDPVSIYGRSWNPPWSWFKGDASAAVVLEFPDRVIVSYDGSWCSNGGETSWNADWWFECEKGAIALRDDQVYTRVNGQEMVTVPLVRMERENQAYLLHEFYLAVAEGQAPATTCQDNIKSLGIVFDTLRSFETALPVQCRGGLM